MDIVKYDVYRGPNIGVYSAVNDNYAFIPNGFVKSKAEKLSEYLNVDYVFASVASTRLIGALMVVNNNGMLLPKTSYESELSHLKKSTGMNIDVLDGKYTALGNLICANDKGGVVSPIFSKEDIQKIQDVLGIEVIQKRVAGYHQTGVVVVATSHGAIIHPETDDEDIKKISNVLGVKVEPATINSGVPYLSSGILANNKSIVVGSHTNGPEIMMLTRAFM